MKSKIYKCDAQYEDEPKGEPLTFADLEVGDFFRWADWDENNRDSVLGLRQKTAYGEYRCITAMAPEMATEMATAAARVTGTATTMVTAVVRYDVGICLTNRQEVIT